MLLASEQLKQFHDDGYLLVRNVFTGDEVAAMRRRVGEYLSRQREYPSAWVQMEAKVADGSVKVAQETKGYRKLTHITMVDPLFHDMVVQPNFSGILQGCLESKNICAWGSGVFLKQSQTGARQPWHRDAHGYAGLSGTIWSPLMDATVENGCIQVAPGSHKAKVATEDVIAVNAEEEENYHVGRFSHEIRFLEMKAGDIVLWNMRTLHSSDPNLSDSSRWALAVHCVTTEAVLAVSDADRGPHELIAGDHDERTAEAVGCAHCYPNRFAAFAPSGGYK